MGRRLFQAAALVVLFFQQEDYCRRYGEDEPKGRAPRARGQGLLFGCRVEGGFGLYGYFGLGSAADRGAARGNGGAHAVAGQDDYVVEAYGQLLGKDSAECVGAELVAFQGFVGRAACEQQQRADGEAPHWAKYKAASSARRLTSPTMTLPPAYFQRANSAAIAGSS